MSSHITNGPIDPIFKARIMGKHHVAFFKCRDTGYIQTEEPYWLSESYASPINVSDTGVLLRNSRFLPIAGCLMFSFFGTAGRFLDYAGGYGVFTRMMRDAGFDCYWHDSFTSNLLARGFEYDPTLGPLDAITAFEVFEHLQYPCNDLKRMLRISGNILFSTLLLPNPVPAPEEWWYYGLEHGQHISFYTRKSLDVLARDNGLRFVSNGSDLHYFLNSNSLPTMVAARWLRGWLRCQRSDVRSLILDAYVFERLQRRASSLKGCIRMLYDHWRLPGFFHMRPKNADSVIESLRKTSIATDYAEYLLHHGSMLWPRLNYLLNSRTMDDMRLLQKIVVPDVH